MTTDLVPHQPKTAVIPNAGELYNYLTRLDDDPNWESTVDIVSNLLHMINTAMWSIGYVLVFLRFRAQYHTVKFFRWNDRDVPDEVHTFIRERYGVKLTDGIGEEFLLWHSVRFEKFWLLLGPGEIRVWEKEPVGLEELQFLDHLSTIEKELFSQLGGNRLYPYYRTARVWGPERQYEDVSWTWHYAVTNYAASELEVTNLSTEKDWQILSDLVYQRAKELTGQGITSVAAVRGLITEKNDRKRGWVWATDIPRTMDVLIDERRVVGLEFVGSPDNEPIINGILYTMGLLKKYHVLPKLFLRETHIELEDGQIVALCPDMDAIQDAFLFMASKLELIVRR